MNNLQRQMMAIMSIKTLQAIVNQKQADSEFAKAAQAELEARLVN